MDSRKNFGQEPPKQRSHPKNLAGWEATATGTAGRGVAADLWTRALALEDKSGNRLVLVSTDIHIFTRSQHREISEAVRKRHGIEEGDLMLIATHTHSGPALPTGFDPGISWGLNQDEMRKLDAASDRVREQTLDAIARALSDLQPAKLSFGRGKIAFGVNRRVRKEDGSYDFGANPSGVSDPDVPVLLIESMKGVRRAVAFTYACHCTSIRNGQEGFYKYHPDYAGVAAEQIERQLPGSTALYATGCAGEIDPQPQGGVRQAEMHGQTLSAEVLATLRMRPRRGIRGPLRTTYREIALPLAAIPSRQKYVEASREPGFLPAAARSPHSGTDGCWNYSQRSSLSHPDLALWERPHLGCFVWGSHRGLCLASQEGTRSRPHLGGRLRERGPVLHPLRAHLEEGGYEAGWDADQGPGVPGATSNVLFYGWAVPLAAGVEDRVIAAVHSMLKK